MIAYIKGKLIGKGENFVVIENGGVGYKVFTTPKILENQIGAITETHIHTHVREDALNLFGFGSAADLDFFEMLITVSGVGPKVALSILSSDNTDLIKQAIMAEDAAVFTRVGGVGKKTAEKIILELRGKISEGGSSAIAGLGKGSGEFVTALENLGYSPREIKEVLAKIDHTLPTEEKVRQALKMLSR